MRHVELAIQLADKHIVVAPGIFDGFSAAMAEKAGFSAAYLSGASIAYTRFGRPDIGLVCMSEVAETLSVIRERVEIPIIVDADTGFGNAINVQRTVRKFERCGANAIQLEDQTIPKRCGHLKGKTLVSAAEMVGKIKAATDARTSDKTLIVGRTDAIAIEGFDAAIERAEKYVEAGADILFIEAPSTEDEMREITKRFKDRVPLLSNMVEGGSTPMFDADALQDMGFSLVIFPGGLVRARAHMEHEYFSSLKTNGWNRPFGERMLDLKELNNVLGTDKILEQGAAFDPSKFEEPND